MLVHNYLHIFERRDSTNSAPAATDCGSQWGCSLWLAWLNGKSSGIDQIPVLFAALFQFLMWSGLRSEDEQNKRATRRWVLDSTQRRTEPRGQTLEAGYILKTLNMAISAAMVFPEPVGAPSRTLVSLWYSVWKIWVWMGLKWVNLYRLSNSRFPKAVTGSGCRSSSSEGEKTNPDSLWRQQVGYVKPKVARLYRIVLEGSNTFISAVWKVHLF